MNNSQAKRAEVVSWLYVAVAVAIIFATVFYARVLRDVISQWASDDIYTVLAFVGVGTIVLVSIFLLAKAGRRSLASYLWLAIVFAIFGGYVIAEINVPIEALHFVEYGLLGILLYRALSHRISDRSIYLSVAMLGAVVGIVDEFVQWAVPGRFWGIHDIWIDFFAVLLTQLGIAKGINPAATAAAPTAHGLQWLCRTSLLAVILLGASTLNTPNVVAWYGDRVGVLAFLKQNTSTMFEFGYLHEDSSIGQFNSRFSLGDLRQTDQRRGKAAAAIVDRYPNRDLYRDFLKIYTPMTDPFVHEVGVRFAHRDNHLRVLSDFFDKLDEFGRARHATIGYRENQILKAYYPETLKLSNRAVPPEKLALARANMDTDTAYFSWVSKTLVTSMSKPTLAIIFVLLAGGLLVLERYFASRHRKILAHPND